MNIRVENLSPEISEQEVSGLFEEFGVVASVSIVNEAVDGFSKRVAFVEMPLRDEGLAAVKALNSSNFKGAPLSLIEVSEREKSLELEKTRR
ncbi:MAG: RNA recognition motif domain-containing protein [Endomicrobiales bacterium]